MSCRIASAAIAESVVECTQEGDTRLPVLFGGIGSLAVVAARAAVDHDAAGLLTLNGSLLKVTWRSPQLPSPILMLASPELPWTASTALRLSAGAFGKRARFVGFRDGDDRTERALADWGRAVVRGGWPETGRRSLRVALPVAAALAVAPTAGVLLSGTPVGAAQRVGDGVATPAPAGPERGTLSGLKVGSHQRHGDGILPHAALGTIGLTDSAGFRWVVNTDVSNTTSDASSASGAINNQAGYTQSVTASTTAGGTTQSAMTGPYDGYSGLLLSVNGVCTGITAGCDVYAGAGAAQSDCNGRELLLPSKQILGLDVSRRIYVPSDDHFERTLNVFTNPGTTPITATMSTASLVSAGGTTTVTGTSAGGTTVTPADEWVTTGGAFSGGPPGGTSI